MHSTLPQGEDIRSEGAVAAHDTLDPWPRQWVVLAWLIILAGAVLRVVRYLAGRSLWGDEAMIALNLRVQSYADLLSPVVNRHDAPPQSGPIGWFWLEKLSIDVFGENEYAMRLVPLAMGLLSLPLFFLLARRCLTRFPALVALTIFALLESLIYYSSELKPYSNDVAISVLVMWITIRLIQSDRMSLPNLIGLALIGIASMWFSLGSVMVLGGCGIVLGVICLYHRRWQNLVALMTIGLAWAINFATIYTFSLKDYVVVRRDLPWVEELAYWPFPPHSVADLAWPVRTFYWYFTDPVGLRVPGIAMLLFVIGVVFWRKTDKRILSLLLLPFVFTAVASALGQHPFPVSRRFEIPLHGRVVMFLLPAFILMIGAGTGYVNQAISSGRHVIIPSLLVLLLGLPAADAAKNLIKPREVQEIRPILDYINRHRQKGDVLYLDWGSEYPFMYYRKKYPFDELKIIQGFASRHDWSGYERQMASLEGYSRVWVVFSYVYDWKLIDEERVMLHFLDQRGDRLDETHAFNAAGYLYDLNSN